MSKIAMLTLTVGEEYQKKMAIGVESKVEYCQKWGYSLINETRQLDQSRPIPWSKIDLILRELPKWDYLVWMDADTMIINDKISIEQVLLMLPPNKNMLIGHDLNCLNTGVLIIKPSPRIQELFTKIQSTHQFDHHNWWEQRALIEFYYDYKDVIEILDRQKCHLINGYLSQIDPQYPFQFPNDKVKGDWCLHLAGIRNNEMIEKFMKELKGITKEWQK